MPTCMSAGLAEASARQYVLRIKSLLGYAHALGYTPFNAGATIKVRSDAGSQPGQAHYVGGRGWPPDPGGTIQAGPCAA
jgi:hypothetical protein